MGGKRQGELIVMCLHGREDCASSNRQLDRQGLVNERNSLDHVIKKGIIADSVGLTVIC